MFVEEPMANEADASWIGDRVSTSIAWSSPQLGEQTTCVRVDEGVGEQDVVVQHETGFCPTIEVHTYICDQHNI